MIRASVFRCVVMALAACAFLLAPGCAGGPEKIPSSPLAPGVSYSGDWYSPEYEFMKLSQKRGEVTGTFSYKSGGTLKGSLDGNVLYFDWIQPGDFEVARREVRGRGYLVLSSNGKTFSGEWGYGEKRTGGGSWSGERIQKQK